MTASFTTRRILCTALAATLVALPSNGALAAPAAPTTTPAAAPPATSTTPTSAPSTSPAPTSTAPTGTPPADGTTPPADGTTPPADGTTPVDPNADPNAVPADGTTPEEPPVEEPKPEVAPAPLVPEGPERPPEPTVGNGKYKAKGTGLMIAGGTLFGLGLAGILTTYFLTKCPEGELENSYACKNRENNTFAVPATASLALLGAVLLFVGAGYHVRYKRWERWTPAAAANKKTALTPTFLRGGAGVSYTVKF